MKHFFSQAAAIPASCTLLLSGLAGAQEMVSRTLSEKIYRGDGVIDLLKDIGGSELTQYFNQSGGLLLLGADINEDNSGNESRSSQGVAIKQVQLSISTNAGDFTFACHCLALEFGEVFQHRQVFSARLAEQRLRDGRLVRAVAVTRKRPRYVHKHVINVA